MLSVPVCVSGIKPTGVPHLGNYFAVVKPGLQLADKFQTFFFIADYHALNAVQQPEKLRKEVYEVTATWLACGLNTEKTIFYRQSCIPEIIEIGLILSCVTSKGLMNRSHAYKSIVAENEVRGSDADKAVNMGLFNYPILMAADILTFDAAVVPIGKDQLQHLEIANDIAEAFHRAYHTNIFTLPKAMVDDSVAVVPGIDGRKMSKSYHNTIPLFADAKELEKKTKRIVTTSQSIEDPKDPTNCNLFSLYKLVSSKQEQADFAKRYRAGGLSWGDAKNTLFLKLNTLLQPLRERYLTFIHDKPFLEKTLLEGEKKARPIAKKKLEKLRKIIGIA